MSAVKSKGLGKGLGALFDDIEINVPTEETSTNTEVSSEVLYIDINEIRPNSKQPRKNFKEEAIDELAKSIEIHGVIQPVMVRKFAEGYELVAGERRWRAARKAGLKTIPSIVRDITDEQNVFFALIENMQREDLNPIEEAEALFQIANSFELTQEEVSRNVGKSRPYIANALRLLRLPKEVRTMIENGTLSGGHGKAIASIKDEDQQCALARHVVSEGCSVRETEVLAASGEFGKGKKQKKSAKTQNDHDVIAIEEELQSLLGTKVLIKDNGEKGKIELNYYSRDELDGLIDLLRTVNH